ncbi:glycosyl hydrolase 53 family protein [Ligilactobacillus faecis]|uniref:glycosyl hydrolase 53 family protein n=1 Tax=Ligilactobacillus faecis TaxID=762833 RepID=UPI00246899B5|nr:glycosyl hydrolase 53 family protein [Ligilactobacillus faecis]WGN90037.1 glycosyl hydrolase 53 family protein [Ligilactobacillus faecis]
MFERKVHYKMYKAGKKWVFAAITTFALGTVMTTTVSADETTQAEATTAVSQTASTQTATQTAKPDATTTEATKEAQTVAATDVKATPQEVTTEAQTNELQASATTASETTQTEKTAPTQTTSVAAPAATIQAEETKTPDTAQKTKDVASTNATTPVKEAPTYTQVKENGNWYLKDTAGNYMTGFQTIAEQNKVVYYDPTDHQMQYGQQKINGDWYLFDTFDGAMQTGVQYIKDQDKLVYYNEKGQMQHGTVTIAGQTYQTNEVTGAFVGKGQQKIANNWYLFDNNGKVLTGFQNIKDQNKTVYYSPTTAKMQYGQQKINNNWYSFDTFDGAMKTGFVKIPEQNKTVYYAPNGQMQYGQQKINNNWYNFDTFDGAMKTGFVKIPEQNKTVYYAANGQMQYGWHWIDNATRYFDTFNGAMTTGQRLINGHWYLFDQNGAMQRGLQTIKEQNKTVYYNQDGWMLYGWQWVNNATRYFDTFNGAMKTGQQKINGHWYLFAQNGAMQRGYQYIPEQQKIVYYNQDGWMLYGQQKIAGVTRNFDTFDGALKATGQQKLGADWYLFSNDGKVLTGFQNIKDQNKTVYYSPTTAKMQYGQQKINNNWYNFDTFDGAMKTGFVKIPEQNKTVYYAPNGQMQYGWQEIADDKYYFDTFDGAMYTGSHNIDGKDYTFDAKGRLLPMTTQAYREQIAQEIAKKIETTTGQKIDHDWDNQNDNYLAYSVHDVAQLVARSNLAATSEAVQTNLKNNALFTGKADVVWVKSYTQSDKEKGLQNIVADFMQAYPALSDLSKTALGVGVKETENGMNVAVVVFTLGDNTSSQVQTTTSPVTVTVSDVYTAPGVNITAKDGLTPGSVLETADLRSFKIPESLLTGPKGEKISEQNLNMIFSSLAGNESGLEGQKTYEGTDGNVYHYVFWLNDKVDGQTVGKQAVFLAANKDTVYGGPIKVSYSATLTWGAPVAPETPAAGTPTSQMTTEQIDLAYKTGTDTGLRYDAVKVEPIAGMTSDMIRGVDIGSYQSLIDAGVKFYDFAGNEAPIYKVLADAGVNWIRLRVWNDPFDAENETYAGGACSEANVVKMAKDASKYGLKVLLDFHYSDFWADPAKQPLPKAWVDQSGDALAKSVYNYTSKVLGDLKATGVDVGMVQIGNEITNGVFGIYSNRDRGESYLDVWGNKQKAALISQYLNAGSQAVRKVLPNAQIAIQLETPNVTKYRNIMTALKNNNVDYDLLGTSYYPFWSTHDGNGWYKDFNMGWGANTPKSLEGVQMLAKDEFGKKVVVLETGWINNVRDSDGTGNSIGADSEIQAYSHDPQGQVDAMSDMYKALVAQGGLGGFWWEPAWIPVKAGWENWQYNKDASDKYGTGWASKHAVGYAPDSVMYYEGKPTWGGSTWDNVALFDDLGYPLQSLKMYNGFLTGYETPKAPEKVSSSVAFKVDKIWNSDNVQLKDALNVGDTVSANEVSNALSESAQALLRGEEGQALGQTNLEKIGSGLGGVTTALEGNKTYYTATGEAYHYVFWLAEGKTAEQKAWNFYNDNQTAKYGETLTAKVEATVTWGEAKA